MDEINTTEKITHSQDKHGYQSENIQSTLKHDSSKDTYKIIEKTNLVIKIHHSTQKKHRF